MSHFELCFVCDRVLLSTTLLLILLSTVIFFMSLFFCTNKTSKRTWLILYATKDLFNYLNSCELFLKILWQDRPTTLYHRCWQQQLSCPLDVSLSVLEPSDNNCDQIKPKTSWSHILQPLCPPNWPICCQRPPHQPSAPAKKPQHRGDPPVGKRWQRSTCSPSAHCPLQLPGPWKQIRGLIFNSSFLLALLLRALPSQQLQEPVNPTMCRSMTPCSVHRHRSATHPSPAEGNQIFIYHPN